MKTSLINDVYSFCRTTITSEMYRFLEYLFNRDINLILSFLCVHLWRDSSRITRKERALANVLQAEIQHHNAFQTNTTACMRRATITEGINVPFFFFFFFFQKKKKKTLFGAYSLIVSGFTPFSVARRVSISGS